MRTFFTALGILLSFLTQAQVTISGKVTDEKGESLPGANVYLKDTYDGATVKPDGSFSFSTDETGEQVLVVSFIGFELKEMPVQLEGESATLNIKLKEKINQLNAVTITAGAFEAGDAKKAVALKPLDIVTTASAMGDIAGAIQTLPGTQKVADDGRLFVRGGDGREAKVFIDGLYVQNPYDASVPNVPTRTRFSPFLFKGTLFSSGGYSAEYGQALSSVLNLNTKDLPAQEETNISLMSVGADVAHNVKLNNTSVWAKAEMTDLSPYMGMVDQAFEWHKAPQSYGGALNVVHKGAKEDLFKVYADYQFQQMAVTQPDIRTEDGKLSVDLQNNNFYTNTSYKSALGEKSSMVTGFSLGWNENQLLLGADKVSTQQLGSHLKTVVHQDWSDRLLMRFGGEWLMDQFEQEYQAAESDEPLKADFREHTVAGFAEADVYFSNQLVGRLGGRFDHASRLGQLALSPRASLAYKLNNTSQVSFAYGMFNQLPESDYMKFTRALKFEKSTHYILNYQISTSRKTFRIEGYYKLYNDLVTYEVVEGKQLFHNNGNGYARGVELFWRNKELIKNGDFWFSYSLLDTKRKYAGFPEQVVPTFGSKHNASFVYKHFISSLKSMVGGSYSWASGRPYHNPNMSGFNQQRTKAYNSLSLNWAYLYRQHIIFYAAATNVLDYENEFGYRYSPRANKDGQFASEAIRSNVDQFFFLGVFITLTKDKEKNRLNEL